MKEQQFHVILQKNRRRKQEENEMLTDAKAGVFSSIAVCSGYTDLRKGIDQLAATLSTTYGVNPYVENQLFLFCGRASYKIKGLIREEAGFVLVNLRLKNRRFHWPRDERKGLIQITHDQYLQLMSEGTFRP